MRPPPDTVSRPRAHRIIRLLGLLTLLGALAGTTVWLRRRSRDGTIPPGGAPASTINLAARLTALEARERLAAQTFWAPEMEAQRYGEVFERFWDALNAATNKWKVAAAFAFGDLLPGSHDQPRAIGHDIVAWESETDSAAWDHATWQQRISEWEAAGWQLVQSEFRHNRFEPGTAGRPPSSHYYVSAHLIQQAARRRLSLSGTMRVEWEPAADPAAPGVRRLDARGLQLLTRDGEPGYQMVLNETITPPDRSFFIDPLVCHDLDGDGLSEVLLIASNVLFQREPDGRWIRSSICGYPLGLVLIGVLADFDGDRVVDLLCARFEGMVLFRGSPGGTFDEPGRLVWRAEPHLKYGQALACGDIDDDGDLDVWLGQYKGPFDRGQMPTPFYDANDGNPSYLLSNDGQGQFHDVTAPAGLAEKRRRRNYSASLVDLDGDRDLELLAVNDFAGIDVFANDGAGHFRDVTDTWIPERHGFGMAHRLADFNQDGRLDLLVIGMHCPTALRLAHSGLARPGFEAFAAMNSAMGAGNRLYLNQASGGFELAPSSESLSRSGWSWGCSAFDFDNDGWLDVYIANGHETRQSVRDYEPHFWLHDIYVAGSSDDIVSMAYFTAKFARTRARGQSYGGYERNRLFWNRQGASFLDIGFLMGVALPEDCRNLVADDLDGDGRPDLLVTSFEVWPTEKQTLRIFQNQIEPAGHWIGVRLRDSGNGQSPVGARVILRHDGLERLHAVVTGDSHRSQHAPTAHFGLGRFDRVEQIEVRWPDGSSSVLDAPAVDHYHQVPAVELPPTP